MLVSSIARFNAIHRMNNSVFGMIQASNNMINTSGNLHAFGGENDLAVFHQTDQKLTLDMLYNSLQYKLAYVQLKTAEKRS